MPAGYPPSQSNVGAGVQGMKLCKFPGCKRPCFREGTRVHEFCGRSHASQFAATMTSGSSGKCFPCNLRNEIWCSRLFILLYVLIIP